jgi:hypothetical protein
MAVNFLDNLDLNGNQLLNGRIQNLSSDPTSANAGDIIYNTTQNKLKYYDGTTPFSANGWIGVPDGTGIGGSGTVGTIPVFSSTTELADSQLQTSGSGSSQTFTFNTNGVVQVKGDLKVSTGGIIDSNSGTGTSGQLLSSTGTQIAWINAPVSYTKWVLTGDTGSQDITDGNTVLIQGGTNVTTAATATDTLTINSSTYAIDALAAIGTDAVIQLTCTPGTNSDIGLNGTSNEIQVSPPTAGNTDITFSLPTDVTIPGDLTVGGGDILLSGTGRIQGIDTVTAATDAVNKQYVDSALVGGFNVKGGFNANTGITAVAGTNLYTNTAIAVGDYYVVTVAGNFFGNAATPLTPGDSVLVQTAAASGSAQESNFAVIQSDTDIANLTQIGIGNVNADTAVNLRLLDVTYTSGGTAKIGLNIKGGTTLPQSVTDQDQIIIWDGTSGNQGNYVTNVGELAKGVNDVNSYAASNSSSGTSHGFTHNLGTRDVIVQLYDTSSFETVYATVERVNTNEITVTTASSIAAGTIRATIAKVR